MKTIKLLAKIVIWYVIIWANYAQLESIREIAPQAFQVISITGFILLAIIVIQAIDKGGK